MYIGTYMYIIHICANIVVPTPTIIPKNIYYMDAPSSSQDVPSSQCNELLNRGTHNLIVLR